MKESIKSIIREALCSYEERRYAVLAALQEEVADEVADLASDDEDEYSDDCHCQGDCRRSDPQVVINNHICAGRGQVEITKETLADDPAAPPTPAEPETEAPEKEEKEVPESEVTETKSSEMEEAPAGKQWVTLSEGAAIIGCSKETLRRKSLRGEYERREDGRVTMVLIDLPDPAAPKAPVEEEPEEEEDDAPEQEAPETEVPAEEDPEEDDAPEQEESKKDDDEEWE